MRATVWLRACASLLPARVRGASRLLQASGLLMVVTAAWFFANIHHQIGPLVLLWLPSPISAAILTAVYRRTSRTERLPEPTRRFWGRLSVVAALVGLASIIQAVDALKDPYVGGLHTPPLMLAVDGSAVLMIVIALYRLPLGRQTVGERVRVAFDASTVMLATAVFIWHFQTRHLMGTDYSSALIASAFLTTVLALVAVFAVAKVVLSSYAFIDKAALRLLALAMLVGSLGPLPQQYLESRPYLICTQVSLPAVMFFATWAGERQRHARPDARRGAADRPRRSFSLLPYAAVAAIDGLLVAVTWFGEAGDDKMIIATAVVLTGLVVLRQVTALRDNGRLLARLDHGATHDALTQLPNRVLFGQRLQRALTAPEPRPVSVALIDLDDFKEVNDTLGHEVGDMLLIAVAHRLTACVRAEDTVARLGGDEFVVVLDGADRATADAAAERMIEALRRPVVAGGHELSIRASIGIADGRTGDDPSRLLRHADIAMYAAKSRSGSAYLHYEDDMAAAVSDQAHIVAELRRAITDDEFLLLYQPIVALDGGGRTGVEALVRWVHPARGTVAPDAFIPAAERTGLIVPLGRWVLHEACRQLAAWTAEYGDAAPAVLNVNVSARELREPGFADEVAAALAGSGIAPHRLALEVTETAVLELGTSVTNLRVLRELGVRIALDDFGTGYSTLALLQDCPVDELKLDRSFTQAEPDGGPTIAAAVIQLARMFGLQVVAEGVETPEQADRLRALGYPAAQGYFFARPMPAAQLTELLQAVPRPEPVFQRPA